jgi:hypothetical protein
MALNDLLVVQAAIAEHRGLTLPTAIALHEFVFCSRIGNW